MYTTKEEKLLVERYAEGLSTEAIAALLDKSSASVVGKLVNLGIYVPKAKVSKVTGASPKTKAKYKEEIEAKLEVKLPDLDKAPKATLIALLGAAEQWLG